MSAPGKLRCRVALQQAVRISDDGGGASLNWSQIATLWARIEPQKGHEKARYDGLESTITHKITLRYRAGITTGMRFLYAGRVFNILAVLNENEQNRRSICLCEEIT